MSEVPDMKQSKKLTFETFRKLPFKEEFSAETDYPENIMPLVYKVWCSTSAYIRNEARLRWMKKGICRCG